MSSQVAMNECREKFWEELSSEEKIEKLGNFVEKLTRDNIELHSRLEDYREHDHINGKIVIPMNSNAVKNTYPYYNERNVLNKNPRIDLKKEVI